MGVSLPCLLTFERVLQNHVMLLSVPPTSDRDLSSQGVALALPTTSPNRKSHYPWLLQRTNTAMALTSERVYMPTTSQNSSNMVPTSHRDQAS
ncbi:hypothetical protein L1049_014092 [Liquidambar formosana]|uniref:Uncharacterized protein n=1 Tax=Liquidambar formosana TaxID=63359 RepID=A0AAP0WZ77_LIQFO